MLLVYDITAESIYLSHNLPPLPTPHLSLFVGNLGCFVVAAFPPSIAHFSELAGEDYMQPLRVKCDFYDARLAAGTGGGTGKNEK